MVASVLLLCSFLSVVLCASAYLSRSKDATCSVPNGRNLCRASNRKILSSLSLYAYTCMLRNVLRVFAYIVSVAFMFRLSGR